MTERKLVWKTLTRSRKFALARAKELKENGKALLFNARFNPMTGENMQWTLNVVNNENVIYNPDKTFEISFNMLRTIFEKVDSILKSAKAEILFKEKPEVSSSLHDKKQQEENGTD